MNIAISGASGFIGAHLSAFLTQIGHHIFPLGRKMFTDNGHEDLINILSQCDIIINLAGAPINKRWTRTYKKELYDSRILVTRKIVQALKGLSHKPQLFISTSAIGYYPSFGHFDENDEVNASGFLPTLCRNWEAEAKKCPSDIRLAITRFGIVLSTDGGALRSILLPVKIKIAGMIAPGSQPFPWISITDLCRAMLLIIQTPTLSGVINFVTPETPTQRTFTEAMGNHYHTWLNITIPLFVFKLIYGEAASFLTTGQKVTPLRLQKAGFKFIHPNIEAYWNDQP